MLLKNLLGALLVLHVGLCKGLFRLCNNTYHLKPDRVTHLYSPYYPYKYPAKSSCLYTLVAPPDYEILAECTINLDKIPGVICLRMLSLSIRGLWLVCRCTREKSSAVKSGDRVILVVVVVLLLLQMVAFGEALYEGCDHIYNLNANSVAYLQSPYYPNKYPSGTSCRYKFVAPLDYEILAECTIAVDKASAACSTEYFYISREGEVDLSGADQFCGSGVITRTTLFRTLVVAYVSGASRYSGIGGTFSCKLTTRPQACDCGWSMNTRIVGGVEASKLEYPSMVGLYHKPTQRVFCGGTIINHRTIVTAAHCTRLFPNPSEIRILAGDHDLSSETESRYAQAYDVYAYTEHPNYNPSNDVNDIALVHTSNNIEWSRGVGPICLPPTEQLSNAFNYRSVDIVGWGTTSFAGALSNTLQKATVTILPNSACSSIYTSLQSSQMCTYDPNKDACQFDSGGPVVFKDYIREFLLGVISTGLACGTDPGLNTRVTSFNDFIRRYAGGNLCYKPMSAI